MSGTVPASPPCTPSSSRTGGAELAADQTLAGVAATHPRSYPYPRASHPPPTTEARFRNRCKGPRRSEQRQRTGRRPDRSGTDLVLVLRMRAAAAHHLVDWVAADRTPDLRSKKADRRLVLRNRRPDLAAKWAAAEEVDLGCSSHCPVVAEAPTTTGSRRPNRPTMVAELTVLPRRSERKR